MHHWANIGGSTSAQYPTDFRGAVTTTIGSAGFVTGPFAGASILLVGIILSGRDATANTTIAVKDHAATATYFTATVAGGVTSHSYFLPVGIVIPVGGISTVCSDTDVTATLIFDVARTL